MADRSFKNQEPDSKKIRISVGTKIILQVSVLVILVCITLGAVLYFGAIKAINDSIGGTIENANLYSLRREMAASTVILASLGVLFGVIISNSIKKPLSIINRFAQELEKCNLSYRISIRNMDEFGSTVNALNKAAQNISEVIVEVKKQSEATHGKIEGASQLFSSVSDRITQVSAATQQISASIEESSASFQEITSKAATAKEQTGKAVSKAKEGLDLSLAIEKKAEGIIEETYRSKQTLENNYEDSKKQLKTAIERAKVVKEIEQMAEEIMSIASQTNLLALNASIEAAHAGDNGSGFAVVANEVKKLSEESSETAGRIRETIEKVLSAVGELSSSSEAIVDDIGMEILKDHERLIDISEKYKSDGTVMKDIASGFASMTETIALAVDEISDNMQGISGAVDEIADNSGEIAHSIIDIKEKDEIIKKQAEQNAEAAKNLKQLVDKFQNV